MISLLEKLKGGEILLADGAMGTELFRRGLKMGECPELFNVINPEAVQEVVQLYIDAGSEIVLTNSLGGSALKLSDYNLEDRTEEINSKAVEIVRAVAKGKAYVAASVGPSGKILKPYGDAEPDELRESFARQVKAMAEAGADAFCIETMIDLSETEIAVKTAKAVAPDIPVMATMTFNETPKGFFTVMGNNIPSVVEVLTNAGVDIIGSNCGNGLEKMINIAREFKKATDLPLIIQSNAGMPETKNGELHFPETPEFFASKVGELIETGVKIIGGCCGTGPEHIRAIRMVIDSF
ncbi:homocysteine S-methyltransferase family protein [Bacteroidota bacterium]